MSVALLLPSKRIVGLVAICAHAEIEESCDLAKTPIGEFKQSD